MKLGVSALLPPSAHLAPPPASHPAPPSAPHAPNPPSAPAPAPAPPAPPPPAAPPPPWLLTLPQAAIALLLLLAVSTDALINHIPKIPFYKKFFKKFLDIFPLHIIGKRSAEQEGPGDHGGLDGRYFGRFGGAGEGYGGAGGFGGGRGFAREEGGEWQ